MKISQFTTRITGFARTALAAATRKPHLPSAIANRPSATGPLAMATILRPQARERWMLPQVGAITPQYIEMTLRGALAGAHIPQWELFNLMEDTWPRLRKNIFELKMAVRNRRPIFEAYRDEDLEESPAATERMQLVSAALRKMQPDPTADEGGFDDMLFDILDAWFKGVSVLEIDWHVTQTHRLGRFIAPRCTRWANPIHYAWDTDLRLGLSVATATDAVAAVYDRRMPARGNATVTDRRYNNSANPLAPFPADRFLVAKCKTKSGSILGGALLRPLVWWWCAANFSADWLLNLAQIFGLPFRWATYEPTAAQETVDRICSMLQNMGSAGWAAFPAGTSLELKADGQKSGSQTPQGDMLDRADKQCDLLVLGQTLTTDTGGMGSGGGSHALGQVHADVRSGIIDAAAKFTAGVIEQQLIPAILRLNYGDTEEAPTLHLQPVTADNLQEKAAILTQLHAAGAGSIIPLDWLGKTFGIPKPKDGEATLEGNAETSLPAAPFAAANFDPNQPRGYHGRWSSNSGNNHSPTNGSPGPTGDANTSNSTPSPESGGKSHTTPEAADPAPQKNTPRPVDNRPIDPRTGQRIVAPASPSDPTRLFRTKKEAAIAAARIIVTQNHGRYEYGASIYRHLGPNNTVLGYSYSAIEEGPEPPSVSAVMLRNATRTVKIPSGGSINQLAGTIHSHPFDRGFKEDLDQQRQKAFMIGQPLQDYPAGAFSFEGGDIENSIQDQSNADKSNPASFQQEHYLITAEKHIWMYEPEHPVIGHYSFLPENALKKKRFSYVGQLKD